MVQKMNLTATKEAEEVMERHIEDSLAILPPIKTCYINLHSNDLFDQIHLIDVGSGAGIPGLVLAIACPGTLLGSKIIHVVFVVWFLTKKPRSLVFRLESYSTGVDQ